MIINPGNEEKLDTSDIVDKYLGTSYILSHKADFEPGRTSDFTLKIKFTRDLYDLNGRFVETAEKATNALALSIRDFTGPDMSIEPLTIQTGNGSVSYAGKPSISNSPITFSDYIGQKTEYILLAWYSMAHNVLNDKIGFKEYYAQDGILYKWAPNGTRQISWMLKGCWINQYKLGSFSKNNPDQRMFETTILYDKAIPFGSPDFKAWEVNSDPNYLSRSSGTEYTDYTRANYLGTQNNHLTK